MSPFYHARSVVVFILILILLGELAATFCFRRNTVANPSHTPGIPRPEPRPEQAPPPPAKPPYGKEVTGNLGNADLESTGQFQVRIELGGDAAPGDAELAERVKRVLLKAKPRNPGRADSFPRWESVELPGEQGPYRIEVVPLGWVLNITHVLRLPHDNWRATVDVHPLARTVDYHRCFIASHHIEYDRYLNGSLELFSDAVDPTLDPAEGLILIVRP